MKTPLLFLCHRIPYPPNKGDKIRSFHLLHHLSKHFDIYLASFVDDPDDWPWASEVQKFCCTVYLRPLSPWRGILRCALAILTGEALSIRYYRDRLLERWVEQVVSEKNIKHAIVYSSCMAQFLPKKGAVFQRKVIDFVDVDSDKWTQYAAQKRAPMRWIYQREARCLLRMERALAETFDAGLFVSASEADFFHKLSPTTAHKIGYYNNGVNCEYFDPDFDRDQKVASPFPEDTLSLVFTGAMDYWPNVDAVRWFAQEVMPSLRSSYSQLTLTIVGGNPTRLVERLALQDGIIVTGRVRDVRPYLKHALAVVAPMRIARGVQNKVLEGMAMALPVLVSHKALEGIAASHGREVLLAESVSDYRVLIEEIINRKYPGLGERARESVLKNFNWDNNLPEVVFLLGNDDALPQYAKEHVHV